MAVTLEMAMRECNNFFERCKYTGEIRIAGGKIVPDVGSPYVYISGSARNDGVHSLVSGAMEDAAGEETFDGTLWFLYPPRPFVEIAKQCAEYETFASTRSVQIATAEMHRIAIYTFFERVLSR